MRDEILLLVLWGSINPIFGAQPFQSASSESKKVERNLNRYEKAGPYVVRNHPVPDRARLEAEIRGFLWKHWSARRLGMLVATGFNMEGDPTTSTYFVEPDKKGRWVIHVESSSTIAALLPKGEEPRRMKHEETYLELSRVELLDDAPAQQVPIPDDDTRPPEKYKLRLKQEGITSTRFL
jgi:hypothetical protein